jgi:hypothetical protein
MKDRQPSTHRAPFNIITFIDGTVTLAGNSGNSGMAEAQLVRQVNKLNRLRILAESAI